MKGVKLMNSPQGRAAQALAGLVLIAAGVLTGGADGPGSRTCRLVPLAAGATGTCLAAPLLRAPLRAR